jgi:hypothetical protein
MHKEPPTSFVSKVKKVDDDGVETEKIELIKFGILDDPENPMSRYSKRFNICKDGGSENIKTRQSLKTP